MFSFWTLRHPTSSASSASSLHQRITKIHIFASAKIYIKSNVSRLCRRMISRQRDDERKISVRISRCIISGISRISDSSGNEGKRWQLDASVILTIDQVTKTRKQMFLIGTFSRQRDDTKKISVSMSRASYQEDEGSAITSKRSENKESWITSVLLIKIKRRRST